MALVLIDHLLRHRGQNGDISHSVPTIPAQADHQ
jgi:chorismate synthase